MCGTTSNFTGRESIFMEKQSFCLFWEHKQITGQIVKIPQPNASMVQEA